MWEKLKAIWNGKHSIFPVSAFRGSTPTIEEIDAEDQVAQEQQAANQNKTHHLDIVAEAMASGDFVAALRVLARVLMSAAPPKEAFMHASQLMAAMKVPDLASGFAVLAQEQGPVAAINLSATFLSMDDPAMALAMASEARRRTQGVDPLVLGLLAESTARLGRHEDVVKLLEHYEGNWPDPVLLRRYALSAVLSGKKNHWERIASAVADDPAAEWIQGAAVRADSLELQVPSPDARPLREALFVEYGSVLVSADEILHGTEIGAELLARCMLEIAEGIKVAGVHVDRVAYITSESEVFAHWLAAELEISAMPLSARIKEQLLVVVVTDDEEMASVVDNRSYQKGPVILVQILKDPLRAGVFAADFVAILGSELSLPLALLHAEKMSQRLSPRMLAEKLRTQAKSQGAGLLPNHLKSWVGSRKAGLSFCKVPSAERRPPYMADVPQWALNPQPISELEPNVVEVEAAVASGVSS
jgi:hypothetical protein